MAYPKGAKRPEGSGRAKGTPNKIKTEMIKSVEETCREVGFDPIKALIFLAARSAREDIKMQASRELLKYIQPQKRSVEITGNVDLNLQGIIEELSGKSDDELKQIVLEDGTIIESDDE